MILTSEQTQILRNQARAIQFHGRELEALALQQDEGVCGVREGMAANVDAIGKLLDRMQSIVSPPPERCPDCGYLAHKDGHGHCPDCGKMVPLVDLEPFTLGQVKDMRACFTCRRSGDYG